MAESQPLMAGKRGIVMGVANDRSIAWGIARVLAAHGAEIAFSYQAPQLERRVRPLAESIGASLLFECDAGSDDSLDGMFAEVAKHWDSIDFIVHAIAFSDRTELTGKYVNTSRANFQLTLDVSCYTLTAVCQRAMKYMTNGGSIVTLTYYGAERVMPHYNVMGVAKAALEASVRYLAVDLGGQSIRVNAISAGPIKTLAASGIGDFRYILKWNELNSPLKRNVTLDDVGNAGLYLLSDLGAGVTGEVHHVDAGYHTVGMVSVDAAEEVGNLINSLKTKA
jgi:enoyl-[acyl-carrier protein] reductase I